MPSLLKLTHHAQRGLAPETRARRTHRKWPSHCAIQCWSQHTHVPLSIEKPIRSADERVSVQTGGFFTPGIFKSGSFMTNERLERLVVALLCIRKNHPATGSSWCWSGAQCPSFPGNVVRRLVKHPHSDICVLKLRKHGQDGAARLKDRYRDLRTSPHCDIDLRLLPVVNGQTFQ